MQTSSVEPRWLHTAPPATTQIPPSRHEPQPEEHSAPHVPTRVLVVVVGGHTAQQIFFTQTPSPQSASTEHLPPHRALLTHTSPGPTGLHMFAHDTAHTPF